MNTILKDNIFYIILVVLLSFCTQTKAQDLNFNENIRKLIENGRGTDTIFPLKNQPSPQQKIQNEQDSLREQNSGNTPEKKVSPTPHTNRRKILRMSSEALYWSRYWDNSYNKFPPYYTLDDTIIVNTLFMPVLFKDENLIKSKEITFYQPKNLEEQTWTKPLYQPAKAFEKIEQQQIIKNIAYRYVRHNHPDYFRHSAKSLPVEKVQHIWVKGDVQVPVEQVETKATDYETPAKFIPDRKYWTSSLESALRFSQNYISPNWYKEGSSNLNILTKNLLQYNYAKDKIQLTNLLQVDVSAYSASEDTLRNYKFGDNLLRFYSNFGFRAISKLFYTIDGEFKAPLFNNYTLNTNNKQVGFLSPYIVNVGLGMKYNLAKKYKQKNRAFTLAINVAPISYTYMASIDNNINWSAQGFPKDSEGEYKHVLSKFGSTVRMDMVVKPNRDVTWKSRLYYNTTYKNVLSEFENSLDLAISRYFSTLINVYLRFDDSVKKADDYDSYIQTNEIISFGFSYKW